MNSIMYLLLTWYTLIMFLKILSHLILTIKSFMKYFKKGVWKYFKIFTIFLKYFKVKYFIVHLYLDLRRYFFSERTVDRWNNVSQQDISCSTVNHQELSEQNWKFVVQRWAFSWTSRSAWPFGVICTKFILDQVQPQLVSYLTYLLNFVVGR